MSFSSKELRDVLDRNRFTKNPDVTERRELLQIARLGDSWKTLGKNSHAILGLLRRVCQKTGPMELELCTHSIQLLVELLLNTAQHRDTAVDAKLVCRYRSSITFFQTPNAQLLHFFRIT